MISPEKVLPKDQLMDQVVEEFHPLIREELRETAEQSVFEDIIDYTALDDARVGVAEKFAVLAGAASQQERESMVRGAFFARQVLQMVYSDRLSLPFAEYCGDTDVDELPEKIARDAAEYLVVRTHVRDLLDEFMYAIDEGRNFEGSAAKTAALIFMLAEQHIANEFLTNFFDSLKPEMFDPKS